MKITRHRYTVNQDYVAQNTQNVRGFIEALTATAIRGLTYQVFLEDDGVTFLHLVVAESEPTDVITNLPSFKKFQAELLASNPVTRPDQVSLSLVARSGGPVTTPPLVEFKPGFSPII